MLTQKSLSDLTSMTLQEYLDTNFSESYQSELVYLSCKDAKLTSLEGIEKCVDLTSLYCDNNQLTSLKGIEKCVKLINLSCSNNQLSSLEGIEKLPLLEYLKYQNNIIQYKSTKIKDIINEIKLEKRIRIISSLL